MAVGARDYIDQLLVKKYSDKQVNNLNMAASAVSAERVLEIMDDYAQTQRSMLALQNKLREKCKKINVRLAYGRS